MIQLIANFGPFTAFSASKPIALTHWDRDKMAAIIQTTFSIGFFNENIWISIKISLKGQIANNPALI